MTDHLLIATAATELKGYFPILKEQVVAAGIDFLYQPLQPPFSWLKLIDWEYTLAKSYPDALIAFCDTWDMLYFGSRKEFEAVVGAQPLLFHTDKQCWPHADKAARYPASPSPWRYVNGTGPAGTGRAIAEAIEYGMETAPITAETTGSDVYDTSKDNDQRFYTDIYLSGRGALDTDCRLSQSLVDVQAGELAVRGGRLFNKVTQTTPLFVHANGAQSMIGHKGLMDLLSAYRPPRPW